MRRLGLKSLATPMRDGGLILGGAALALLIAFAGSPNAALPPIYQIWREFGMITDDAKIPQMLRAQGPVERIERVSDGYRVWAGKCFVPVAVVSIKHDLKTPPIVGPAQIRMESRAMQCL